MASGVDCGTASGVSAPCRAGSSICRRPPSSSVSIADADAKTLAACEDPLKNDPQYYTAAVSCNHRITADDWYQDVRHFELDFDEDIRCHLVGRVILDVAHTAKL